MEIGSGIDFWEGLSLQIGWGLAQGLKIVVGKKCDWGYSRDVFFIVYFVTGD